MVLEYNTIKEPFNRNLLQKDQVANYHRKRKHLDACLARNDLQISEETQIFWNSDETTKNRESRQCEPERLAS